MQLAVAAKFEDEFGKAKYELTQAEAKLGKFQVKFEIAKNTLAKAEDNLEKAESECSIALSNSGRDSENHIFAQQKVSRHAGKYKTAQQEVDDAQRLVTIATDSLAFFSRSYFGTDFLSHS